MKTLKIAGDWLRRTWPWIFFGGFIFGIGETIFLSLRPESEFVARTPKWIEVRLVSTVLFTFTAISYLILRGLGHNDRIHRLEAIIASQAQHDSDESEGERADESGAAAWPWGAHTTPDLDHLAAAAAQWWVTYDPEDPATSPTNEMVVDWLISERGASRDKAKAIASILRPPGLKTGRRPKASDRSDGSDS